MSGVYEHNFLHMPINHFEAEHFSNGTSMVAVTQMP